MEKGSQIPLLVKRRKCSRKIFSSLFLSTTAPLDSTQHMCNSKAHSSECQSREIHSHFTAKHLGAEGTDALLVPVLSRFPWMIPGAGGTTTPQSCSITERDPLRPCPLCKLTEPKHMLKMVSETKQPAHWQPWKPQPTHQKGTWGSVVRDGVVGGFLRQVGKQHWKVKLLEEQTLWLAFCTSFYYGDPWVCHYPPLLVDNLKHLKMRMFSLRRIPEDGGFGAARFQGKGWSQFNY